MKPVDVRNFLLVFAGGSRHRVFDEWGIREALGRSGLRMTHEHFEGEDSMYVHFHDKVYPDLQGWPWTAQTQLAVA